MSRLNYKIKYKDRYNFIKLKNDTIEVKDLLVPKIEGTIGLVQKGFTESMFVWVVITREELFGNA